MFFSQSLRGTILLIIYVANRKAWCILSEAGETITSTLRQGPEGEGETEALRACTEGLVNQRSTHFGHESADQEFIDQSLVSLRPLQLFPEKVARPFFPEKPDLNVRLETPKYRHHPGPPEKPLELQENELPLTLGFTSGQNFMQLKESYHLAEKAPLVSRPAVKHYPQFLERTSYSTPANERKKMNFHQGGFVHDPRPANRPAALLHQIERSKRKMSKKHHDVARSGNGDTPHNQKYKYDFSIFLPRFWRRKIDKIITVQNDVHCGFRAAALSMAREEIEWPAIRSEMFQQLRSNPVFLNHNLVQSIFNEPLENVVYKLIVLKVNGPEIQRMNFPGHAFLLAETYRRPVIFISSAICYTVPPLSHPLNHNKPILIGTLGSTNFVTFTLKEGVFSAAPPIIEKWKDLCLEVARPWMMVMSETINSTKQQEEEMKLKWKMENKSNEGYNLVE